MHLYNYLKSLSMYERQMLARQVQYSLGYLNHVACGSKKVNAKLLVRIYQSKFNRHQPHALQYPEAHYVEDMQVVRAAAVEGKNDDQKGS